MPSMRLEVKPHSGMLSFFPSQHGLATLTFRFLAQASFASWLYDHPLSLQLADSHKAADGECTRVGVLNPARAGIGFPARVDVTKACNQPRFAILSRND